jgi:hypothetical protein
LFQRSVRPLRVVVVDVLAHHCCEVAGPGDQEVVKAFPAQRADEALGDRVRPRCLDRCALRGSGLKPFVRHQAEFWHPTGLGARFTDDAARSPVIVPCCVSASS